MRRSFQEKMAHRGSGPPVSDWGVVNVAETKMVVSVQGPALVAERATNDLRRSKLLESFPAA